MAISGITGVPTIGALQAAQAAPQAAARTEAGAPAEWFDMTAWAGPSQGSPSVTTGAAVSTPAPLAELSASVLSAILR